MKFCKKRLSVFLAALMVVASSTLVFAETETANAALVSAAQSAVDSMTANINAILPIALGLMALVSGIMIGIKLFMKIKNKGTSN